MNAVLQFRTPPAAVPAPPTPVEPPRFQLMASSRSPAAEWMTFTTSLLAHAGIVAAIVVLPLLSEEIVPPSSSVRAFLVAPPSITPPAPPPPPPAAVSAAVRRAPIPPRQATRPPDTLFRAPIEVPEIVVPEEPVLDLSSGDGVEGGVEGGVAGGVLGGVVGGLVSALPTQPPVLLRVGGNIKPPKLLHQVAPVYPEIARQARLVGTITVVAIVGTDGRVRASQVVKGIPLLSEAALEAVRQWRYQPQLLNGQPCEFELTVNVSFVLTAR
jgi:protein TonB